ncbi:TetR/AcrR family transcriptional regulator [Fusibacter bizertensis]|uniref:TetR/AcrR family transcriptional regulator n=1 Tax=Fusibacter bizertensis TaxID=1488331 RepID=A0ABT6NBF6_9FIRM|nr:TetR/AcrR family transcriptional regulator [Fusibacter bizertensis]MDH8677726.1 TetR/AcrR family transcriptional regulator [Fusibacter bizertensis]
MDQKEQIMHYAIRRFNLEGISFKLDDIAKDLKISKKTLYKHYSGKEAIFSAIIESVFNSIKVKENEVFYRSDLNDVEKLLAILEVYPDFEVFNYHHFADIKMVYPEQYLKIESHLENNWEQTIDLLEICISKGYVKPIEKSLFKTIFLGIYKQLLLTDDPYPQEQMRACIEVVFNGLLNK